jgi:hypothetical protein
VNNLKKNIISGLIFTISFILLTTYLVHASIGIVVLDGPANKTIITNSTENATFFNCTGNASVDSFIMNVTLVIWQNNGSDIWTIYNTSSNNSNGSVGGNASRNFTIPPGIPERSGYN